MRLCPYQVWLGNTATPHLHYLHFCDEPTHALEMHGIVLIERVELTCQSAGGVIIVPYMLVIFCQMLESWHALTLGETLPDRHG
jgi:hypothetical protein